MVSEGIYEKKATLAGSLLENSRPACTYRILMRCSSECPVNIHYKHKWTKMTKLKYILFFILVVVFSSCIKPEVIKTIKWNGNTIRLSVVNGGATTSFLYKIDYEGDWFLGKERLIFESYSTPCIKDISVENDQLMIDCFAANNQTKRIMIDLKKINKFIGNPIKYRRNILVKTNGYYVEPDFVKQERQKAKEYGLID